MTPFTVKINQNPLFASYYIDIIHDTRYLEFNWINDDCGIQFIASTLQVDRNFYTDRNTYHMTIDIAQNINEDYKLSIIDPDTGEIVVNKIKMIGLVYNKSNKSNFCLFWKIIFIINYNNFSFYNISIIKI